MAGLDIRVRLDDGKLKQLLGELGPETRAVVRRRGLAVEARARTTAPRRDGSLANAHTTTMRGNAASSTAVIANSMDYAEAVHEGSKPHVIAAKHAKSLRFAGRGGLVFRRRVMHPGAKGKPWLKDALAAERPAFEREIRDLMEGR